MSRSDSELSDLERLSDWSNSESDEESVSNQRNYKTRVDHFNILDTRAFNTGISQYGDTGIGLSKPVLANTGIPVLEALLDTNEFQVRFRLDKPSVQSLLVEIYPHLRVKGARNHGIHPLHQLLLTLRFYALGTMLLSVADFVGVSKSSACRIVFDVSCAIARLYNKYIYMHPDTEQDFYETARFPRVLGALDGTHIRIQSPCSETGEEFRNRKGYFSLNVQAVCNAKLLFMNLVARWPGSAHDATIFNNSELRAQCESGLYGNKWLLADSAYPLKPYLLTPLLNPQSRGEQLYNEAHIRTRNCIERCFGVWKRRFPVVALTLRLSLIRANAVIIATGVLHNICRLNSIADVPPEVEIPTAEVVPVPNTAEEPDYTERAILISNYFNNLSSNE